MQSSHTRGTHGRHSHTCARMNTHQGPAHPSRPRGPAHPVSRRGRHTVFTSCISFTEGSRCRVLPMTSARGVCFPCFLPCSPHTQRTRVCFPGLFPVSPPRKLPRVRPAHACFRDGVSFREATQGTRNDPAGRGGNFRVFILYFSRFPPPPPRGHVSSTFPVFYFPFPPGFFFSSPPPHFCRSRVSRARHPPGASGPRFIPVSVSPAPTQAETPGKSPTTSRVTSAATTKVSDFFFPVFSSFFFFLFSSIEPVMRDLVS